MSRVPPLPPQDHPNSVYTTREASLSGNRGRSSILVALFPPPSQALRYLGAWRLLRPVSQCDVPIFTQTKTHEWRRMRVCCQNVKIQGPAAAGNVAEPTKAAGAPRMLPLPPSLQPQEAARRQWLLGAGGSRGSRVRGKPRRGQPGPGLSSGAAAAAAAARARRRFTSCPPRHTPPPSSSAATPLPARSALPLSIGAETKATGSGGPGRYPRTPGATGPAPRHSPALRGPSIRLPRRAPRCQTSENWPKTHRMNFLVPRIQDGDVSTAEAAGSKTFTL